MQTPRQNVCLKEHMKSSRISIATLMVLLSGSIIPALAGQDRPAQDHAKQQNSRQQAKPQQHARQQKPSAQAQRRPAQQTHQQAPSAQAQRRSAPQQPAQRKQQNQRAIAQHPVAQQRGRQTQQFRQAAWQQHRAANWQADHKTWQQRGGYNGYRIPDDRFRGSFGENHAFRIHGLPFLVVGGYPRFQYGGYWLTVVDPYPENWGANWYDSDEVYVAYTDNGYYLYNRSYPGIGLAVSISL